MVEIKGRQTRSVYRALSVIRVGPWLLYSHWLWVLKFSCRLMGGMSLSVLSALVSLTEPFRAGWARLRVPAPQQTSIPDTAAVWGPGSPYHCAEGTGNKGLRGQGVRPRQAVNRRAGMGT